MDEPALSKNKKNTTPVIDIVRIKALTYKNGKGFNRHGVIDKALGSTGTLPEPLCAGSVVPSRASMGFLWQYVPKKGHMTKIKCKEIKMCENRLNNGLANDLDSERPQRCIFNYYPVLYFKLVAGFNYVLK